MHLRNAGSVRPAPILQGFAQNVVSEMQTWSGMQSVTHWKLGDSATVDGAEFHVDDRELGHIHLDGGIHLLLTEELRDALLDRKLARPFRWGKEWVTASVGSSNGVEHALWLFQIGYDHLKGVAQEHLLRRIQTRDGLDRDHTFVSNELGLHKAIPTTR